MNKKTWVDVHEDEVFSDNSKIEYCKQCKNCIFKDGGTPFSNHYSKSSCQVFQYPNMKPLHVIDNNGICEYFADTEE